MCDGKLRGICYRPFPKIEVIHLLSSSYSRRKIVTVIIGTVLRVLRTIVYTNLRTLRRGQAETEEERRLMEISLEDSLLAGEDD